MAQKSPKPTDERLRASLGDDAFDKRKARNKPGAKRVGNFADGAHPDRGELADEQIGGVTKKYNEDEE